MKKVAPAPERPAGFSAAMLRAGTRVWAIGAAHGGAAHLCALHEAIAAKLAPGDRLAYLGNLMGYGPEVLATIDEALRFRREFLARPLAFPHDIAFLRGCQEEMWQKLIELQFSVNPAEVLQWMLDHGAGPTIEAYGGNTKSGFSAARQGPLALSRWTNDLRVGLRKHAGHQDYLSALRRCARTQDGAILLVSAGLDPTAALETQDDALWWNAQGFDRMVAPYGGFRVVVRGHDPKRRGMVERDFAVSVDAGTAFGEGVAAVCLTSDGAVVERIVA